MLNIFLRVRIAHIQPHLTLRLTSHTLMKPTPPLSTATTTTVSHIFFWKKNLCLLFCIKNIPLAQMYSHHSLNYLFRVFCTLYTSTRDTHMRKVSLIYVLPPSFGSVYGWVFVYVLYLHRRRFTYFFICTNIYTLNFTNKSS